MKKNKFIRGKKVKKEFKIVIPKPKWFSDGEKFNEKLKH